MAKLLSEPRVVGMEWDNELKASNKPLRLDKLPREDGTIPYKLL